MAMTTSAPPPVQKTGQDKIREGTARRIHRDNDTDASHNPATHQESRDRYEYKHFHAADTPDIERSPSSARAQKREKGLEDADDDHQPKQAQQRDYNRFDTSHYNDDSRNFQTSGGGGVNRSGGGRYEQMSHSANRRPDDGHGDPMSEVDQRYLTTELAREDHDRDRGHYDGNPAERERDDLNDRQNGWQANVRVDNRGDESSDLNNHFQNDWRDQRWRETASRDDNIQPPHPWRPNDDARNEQRDGSAYDRDRDSGGNSRFHDEDHGYRTSRSDDRDYGNSEDPNDPRQPREHTATSERDYDDRNPSNEIKRH